MSKHSRQLTITESLKSLTKNNIEEEDDDTDNRKTPSRENSPDNHTDVKRQKTMDSSDESEDNEDLKENEEFSEYELLQRKNILERNQFLQSLGIKNSVKDLELVANQRINKVKPKPKTTPQRRTPITYDLPKREPSRRLRALAAGKKASNETLESDTTNNYETDKEVGNNESFRESVDNRFTGTVSLEEESLGILDKFTFLNEDCKYDANIDLSSCDIDSFRRNLACLKMKGPHKVTTKRIQSICVHPAISKQLALAGSADGYLGLWNMNADSDDDVVDFSFHRAPLNCVTVSNFNHCKIYTTSHDGTVCCVDIEKKVSSNVFSTDFNSRVKHLTWHNQVDAETLLISHGDGSVGVLDLRTDGKNVSWINCFEKSCRTVQLHPVNSDYFLAASGHGGCKIFDLRSCPKSVCVSDLTHPKGLTSAFFSPNGNQIVTTCNDDRLRIFDSSSFTDYEPEQKRCIVHNNHTGRWLSVFKAVWFPNRNDVFLVGSLLAPRRIQLYSNNGSLLYELTHDDMVTISPVLAVHPKLPLIVGGNSSGRIHAFVPPEVKMNPDGDL